MYLELVFPRHNVRFIAISDNIDSKKGEDDFTAIKSLFNEFFVRDTSRKVRAVKDTKARQGKRVNGESTPYGYLYDKETENLVIDEETAPIVKRIFDLCVSGLGPSQIANQLDCRGYTYPISAQRQSDRQIGCIPRALEPDLNRKNVGDERIYRTHHNQEIICIILQAKKDNTKQRIRYAHFPQYPYPHH